MTVTPDVSASKAIMVVDDESDIVFIFRRSLELTGYTVFAFTDPILALEHYKSNVGRYGLVISDVRMPNITGIELAQKIRSIDPDVAIILISAFEMNELGISPDLRIAELISKPVTAEQLKSIASKYVMAIPQKQ